MCPNQVEWADGTPSDYRDKRVEKGGGLKRKEELRKQILSSGGNRIGSQFPLTHCQILGVLYLALSPVTSSESPLGTTGPGLTWEGNWKRRDLLFLA